MNDDKVGEQIQRSTTALIILLDVLIIIAFLIGLLLQYHLNNLEHILCEQHQVESCK